MPNSSVGRKVSGNWTIAVIAPYRDPLWYGNETTAVAIALLPTTKRLLSTIHSECQSVGRRPGSEDTGVCFLDSLIVN